MRKFFICMQAIFLICVSLYNLCIQNWLWVILPLMYSDVLYNQVTIEELKEKKQ